MADGGFHVRSDRFTASSRKPQASDDDDEAAYDVESEPEAPIAPAPREAVRPALDQSWDTFWPFSRRAKLFAVMVFLNFGLLPFSMLILESIVTIVSTLTINTLAQALVLGTFDRFRLRRSPTGKVQLTRTWRVCFFPLAPRRLRHGEFEGVSCRCAHENHLEDWVVAVLLLPSGIFPALLWYWYVMRPERIQVVLCKDHGYPDTVLLRCWAPAQAEEIARTVMDVTRLPRM